MSPDTLATSITGTDYTNIISNFTGLGGVIVAGISVYLSYKWRSAVLRDQVYEKQLMVISELMPLLAKYLFYATAFYSLKTVEDVIEKRREFSENPEESIGILQRAVVAAQPFIPREIFDKLSKFTHEVTSIMNPSNRNKELPEEQKCMDYYIDLVKVIRSEYRINELTKDYQDLIPENGFNIA